MLAFLYSHLYIVTWKLQVTRELMWYTQPGRKANETRLGATGL